MHKTFALALTVLLLASQGSAKAPRQATVSVRDPRPVSEAIVELGNRYGWVISYEDPQYEFAGDTEDVTLKVRKDIKQGEEIAPSKRIIGPRVKDISVTFTEPASPSDTTAQVRVTKQLLEAYRKVDGNAFELRETQSRLAIVPAMFRQASGKLQLAKPLLDTLISVPPDDRNGAEFLKVLCEQLQAQTGIRLFVGLFPQNAFAQYHTKAGYENLPARQVLMDFLDGMPHGTRYSWALLFQQGYALNIRWVKDLHQPIEAPAKALSPPPSKFVEKQQLQ